MEGELVTPPFRVNQTDTHVIVEAQCSLSPPTLVPHAVVEETIFALRCPPYYLPLHFPASLSAVEQVHRSGSIVRVDLCKTDAGLSFIGLEDIQPTMFIDAEPEAAQSSSSSAHKDQSRGKDQDAESMLKDVLLREKLTAVKEEAGSRESIKPDPAASELFSDLNSEDLETNKAAAESAEDARFDEQSYLDSFVDEEGDVKELLKWRYQDQSSVGLSTGATGIEIPRHLQLLLVDVLYAYHLSLVVSNGPPVYPWLVCSLSRSLSSPASPPFTTSDTLNSTLRSGYRRGLIFPLHRNWKVCQRAQEDLVARLARGKQAMSSALTELSDCLVEGEKEATEGPEEGSRLGNLNRTVVAPLIAQVQKSSEKSVSALAEEVRNAEKVLTKCFVAPLWDLELLEQMANEVIAEHREEQESRAHENERTIKRLCDGLTPPLALQEGHDAFVGERSAAEMSKLSQWRITEAPDIFSHLIRALRTYTLRLRLLKRQSTDDAAHTQAKVIIAASRFTARCPWTTGKSRMLARKVLRYSSHPNIAVIRLILQDHIRSLYATRSPGSVTEEGRLRHRRANLSTSAKMSAFEEGEQWKGRLGSNIPGLDMVRSPGSASYLTLKICLDRIATLSDKFKKGDEIEPWELLWPLIVPPLIMLLEDSDPVWRTRGTKLLVQQVLTICFPPRSCKTNAEAQLQMVPVQLLHRANLVPLLQSTLFTSLTYLSHPVGGKLLNEALSALILLAKSLPLGSRARAEMLMMILQEGVLRTWTFLPKTIDALDSGSSSYFKEGEDNESDSEEEDEIEEDVLQTTFTHLYLLFHELGTLSARFIDVTLDFVCTQISGLYDGLMFPRSGRREGFHFRQRGQGQDDLLIRRKLSRVIEAVKVTMVLVEELCACDEKEDRCDEVGLTGHIPPTLACWTCDCLGAYVKAWLAIRDYRTSQLCWDSDVKTLEQMQAELLENTLTAAVNNWKRVLPGQVEEVRRNVVDAEPELGQLFAAQKAQAGGV